LRFVRAHAGGLLPRLLFWAAAAFTFVMAVLPHPPDIPGHPSDKVQHMAAFATLALLGSWAFSRTTLIRLLAWLSLFGAAIEIVQAIPWLHRDSEALDWVADTVAAGAILLIAHWRRARSRVAPPRR
jgi:hypothetical protein